MVKFIVEMPGGAAWKNEEKLSKINKQIYDMLLARRSIKDSLLTNAIKMLASL